MWMMARIKQYLFILLFILIVFIPAVILSFFAIRAVNQEEMVQKRRLEDTLLLELDQTNTIIRLNLEQIILELHNSLPPLNEAYQVSGIEKWKNRNPLVGIPYILNRDNSILYPDITDKNTDNRDTANLFYWRYLNLFSNRESIPIYRNITEEYEEEILERKFSPEPELLMEKEEAPLQNELSASETDTGYGEQKKAESSPLKSDLPVLRSKSALSVFESDSALQEQVYEKAQQEGQQYLQRNVIPQITLTPRKENTQTVVRSVYIESTRYFEEIIQGRDYGIIPRLFDSSFILLYWEKRDGIIAGCEIDMQVLNERLKGAVTLPENSLRFINILDQGGIPVIPFVGIAQGKWRQPFVSKEISEMLPYWETAILLRSPEEFQKQIESSRYFLSLVVLFLCTLIFTGIAAVYHFSSSRLRKVQQRVGFVTNVSHELKTPLTSIRMYSEMMSEGYQKDPEKIHKYSSYIASESQRLTRLINNILDFAKLEKGTKVLNTEITDINDILEEMIPSLKEELDEKGFTVSINLSSQPLFIRCDREAVQQVLINIFSNAGKYSEENKHIGITTYKNEKWVIAGISDRGKGVPKKYRKKIFMEFFRIDTSITSGTKGTGLGLAIAKKIMKQHNGDLIYSPCKKDNYSEGSIFSLLFPLIDTPGKEGDLI